MLAGRWLRPVCMVYALQIATGIALVHAPAGWFVVGLGRNGVEYSVLILFCLAALFVLSPPAGARIAPTNRRDGGDGRAAAFGSPSTPIRSRRRR